MTTLTTDGEIALVEKYALSPNELFAVRALLNAQEGDLSYFARYARVPESIRGSLRDLLLSLQSKGIILKSYEIPEKGTAFDVEDVAFNKNFVKTLYKESYLLGKELFEAYPPNAMVGNSLTMLRGVTNGTKYNDLEDAFTAYGKAIKWNPDIHKEILELVEWAKERNILNCTLGSFIANQRWLDLKALMVGDSGNINYDTVRLL